MVSAPYKAVAALGVAAWLGTMAYLYLGGPSGREPSAGIAASSAPLGPGEEFMGAYIGGERVGWIRSSTRGIDGGYMITQSGEMRFSVQGQPKRISMNGMAETDGKFRLRSFSIGMEADSMVLEAMGSVKDGVIPVSIDLNGEKKIIEIPFSDETVLDLTADRFIAGLGLKAGDRRTLQVIDPQSLSPVAMEIEIVGAEKVPVKGGEIEATRVRRTVGGAVFDAWLDPEGRTLRETGPLGISFVREDPRESAGKRLRTGRDLVESASIPVSRDIPDQETLSSLSIRLSGADTARLAAEGGRQSLSGGVLTVVKESLNPAAAVRLPVTDPRFAEYLRPSTLIESDRPEISAAARKAAGGETGALAAALRISDWLFENIAKKNVAGVPDALATLRNMEGDCNEHTYLFVAMARSLGIPARVNAGIACLRGRFYYHAWPEVWAGTWVTLDPTWGQAPADVTHIRLVQGEGSKLADILGLFGKLKVEVVSWR